MSTLLDGLNEQQRLAVEQTEGPLMILAGAGTGKTTVMTRRVAWLIAQGLAEPDQILALTFTDKAAGEMEERIDQLLPYGYVDVWVSTFHAFCQRLLEQHGIDIGRSNTLTLLSEVDAWLLMRQAFDRFQLAYYKPLGNPTRFLRALLQHISRAKDEGITPDAYEAWLAEQSELEPEEHERLQELAGVYRTYETLLYEQDAIDFGGLLMETLRLFRERPHILRHYQEQFRYIIVDEFQDTNWVQYELLKLLSAHHRNIAVVGDDDQAIYQFRGATVRNIHTFDQDFPDAKHIVLTQNYRSHQEILDQAYAFIRGNNPHRLEVTLQASHGLDKRLQSQVEGKGVVTHLHAETMQDEVELVVREILQLRATTHCAWSDIAILLRANDAAEPFLELLDQMGIPYRFMAMRGLYRKPIVLDTISLLRVIDRPYDSPSVYRLLSHPALGLPERDLVTWTHIARRKGRSLVEAIPDALPQLSDEARKTLRAFSDVLAELREYARRRNALEVLAEALKRSGLLGALLELDEAEQQEASGYLEQFYERVRRFIQVSEHRSLHDFLLEFEQEQASGEEGGLSLDDQAGPDEVRLMTVHGAKGLEFRFVFVVNLVDRRFPAVRRTEAIPLPDALVRTPPPDREQHLAEERRLLYVGMTRAKERLYLTSAEAYGGTRKKKLSLFLHEMGYEAPAIPHHFERSLLAPTPVADRVLEMGATLSPPTALSFTQLVAYDHCPLQYKFAHVLKIPVFGSAALSYGKTMHNTLQAYMTRIIQNGGGVQAALLPQTSEAAGVEEEDLIALYQQQWIDDWYENEQQRDAYRAEGEVSLRAYWHTLQEHSPRPLFLERGFTIKLSDMVIKGRIDRIDACEGGVEIIDYKTGTPKTRKTLSATDKMQLLLYQVAAKEVLGLEPVRLTFHYLKDHSQVSFLGSEEEIARMKETIQGYMNGIRERVFGPTPGQHCQFCDYRDLCPFRK